ncbi:hypothetical protein [Rhodococcus opacus]|uniref:hypothetical protein n=1 Tax=Rhodococcus opacus TaxID=37919 RepID=UPI000FFB421B|nr:hypothetical protein [Rhodococcus opacus]
MLETTSAHHSTATDCLLTAAYLIRGKQMPRKVEKYERDTQDGIRMKARSARELAPPVASKGLLNIWSLQRSAGNAAVARLMATRSATIAAGDAAENCTETVQRCGPVPCDCSVEERAEWDSAHPHGIGSGNETRSKTDEALIMQRLCDPKTQSCPPVDPGASVDVSIIDIELLSTLAQFDAQRPTTDPAMSAVLSRALPATDLNGAAPVIAYAGMVGLGGGVGGTSGVPSGMLATETLAAESIATAEGIAASQGVAVTSTAVVEGSSLGASLMGAGEGLLAIEAAGGAELEAVTGPPGWIVGAVVLVVAAAAIGTGYILLRNPDTVRASTTPSPATPTTATRRYPNQTCEDTELDALQAAKDKICGRIPGTSCSPSKVSPKRLDRMPCSTIRLRIEALRGCLAARQDIQDKCFGGVADAAHARAVAEIQNAINHCVALETLNCAPGHPMANL